MCFTTVLYNSLCSVERVYRDDVRSPVNKVSNIRDLKRANHIVWHRSGYDHHAIVEYVDYGSGTAHVIEYGKKEVERRETGEMSKLYVIPYGTQDDDDTVLARARSRLGERNYNVFSNNCEHFATWCKTGSEHSQQVWECIGGRQQGSSPGNPGVSVLGAAGHVGGYCVGAAIAAPLGPVGMMVGGSLFGFVGQVLGAGLGRGFDYSS